METEEMDPAVAHQVRMQKMRYELSHQQSMAELREKENKQATLKGFVKNELSKNREPIRHGAVLTGNQAT